MNDKQMIGIIRIKLPLVVQALSEANLEAQKRDPDLDKLAELLRADDIDGFYDVHDLLYARDKIKRITEATKDHE